jgi:hypothetical protein
LRLSVRARLLACPELVEGCRKWPNKIPPLAAAELQITENKTAGAKAQSTFVALSARLKSCPDASLYPKSNIAKGSEVRAFSLFL